MKKILTTAVAILMLGTWAVGQVLDEQRTVTTKIADLLAQMPARDEKQLIANMEEMAAMGEDGLLAMASMLSAPGEGDNSRLEYALGGFSFYVSQPGRENWRAMSVKAYCQALGKVEENQSKAFLIRQLQLVGQEDAVSCLKDFLDQKHLCGSAARALASIGVPAASKTLLQALENAEGFCQLSLVEALGETEYAEAAAAIAPLTKSEDMKLRKVAFYALARIAAPSSGAILTEAALEDGLTYDPDNATSAYLLYIKRLIEEGRQEQAGKLAASIFENAAQDNQVHTRTAALKLLTDIRGEKALPLLLEAMENENKAFRAAALKFAADYLTPGAIDQWTKQLRRVEATAQAEIISMLGDNGAKAALPAVIKALRSNHERVRLAAIEATGQLGGNDEVADLLKIMKKGEDQEITAAKNALLIMKADNIPEKIADALPKTPSSAKIALVSILGAKAAHQNMASVFLLARNEKPEVRLAALKAMVPMATKAHLPQLFSLLNETEVSEAQEVVQKAVIEGLKDSSTPTEQAALVLEKMDQAPSEKKNLYFPILASIGGERALQAVVEAFENGNEDTKKAVVQALANWSEVGAARPLYHLAQQPSNSKYLDAALRGYIQLVDKSAWPDAQKLLKLRKAMKVARTTGQKQAMLKALNDNTTFPAMVFAGQYLDDPGLQQEAAHAVMNMALSNKSYHGTTVRSLLDKTLKVLAGTDSEYQKKAIQKYLSDMPQGEGYVPLFNGEDLSGWKGLVANPVKREQMDSKALAKAQQEADAAMRKGWIVEEGNLVFTGEGDNIVTEKKYGDFELFVDWKITEEGDAGIYLRGTPQVQIWDTSRVDVGAQVGSGGLYNNQQHESKPLKVADNPVGEWNHFHILMKGDRVTVYLNGVLVVNNVIMENYWDRSLPIFPEEQIELQAHGTHVAYRNIYIREIPRPEPFKLSAEEKQEGFEVLFDGTHMHHWMGNTKDYVIDNGTLLIDPRRGGRGNLYTKEEYADFVFRFEFQLTPGANNGLGIRAPLEGDAAYVGMELQILDNGADIYKDLKEYQYHGSIYGVIAAKRGYLKPVGEWNYQEVVVKGPEIKVILNGNVILDSDISEARKDGTLDGREHPGLFREKGHIGFLGHGSAVRFKNIRVKALDQ